MIKKFVFLGGIAFFLSCANEPTANELSYDIIGTWSNEAGTFTYVFMENGEAKWLVQRPESVDTLSGKYRFETDSLPMQLDFYDFKTNLTSGKDVYGIVEFPNDSTLRYDNELATSPEEALDRRPTTFNEYQTATFYKQH